MVQEGAKGTSAPKGTSVSMSGTATRREPRPRHIRIPVPLLLSRRHSPLAVTLYALLDVLGRAAREDTEAIPVEATRRWLAWRLGASESGIAKALAQLSTGHDGDTTTPATPAYLVTRQRGRRKSALRTTLAGVPWVEVPEWTLGAPDAPMQVQARVWRFYALTLHLRHRSHGTVAHARGDLAALAGVRPDTVPALTTAAQDAGLLLVAPRPGKSSILAPITDPLTADERETARTQLLGKTCGKPAAPHPCTGTAPHPCTGTAPHPCTGTAIGEPTYGDPTHVDPAPVGAPLPGRPRPENPDRAEPFASPVAAAQFLARMVDASLLTHRRVAAAYGGADPVRFLAQLAADAHDKARCGIPMRKLEMDLAVLWASHQRRAA